LSLILEALKKAQKQRENSKSEKIDNKIDMEKKSLASKRFVFLLILIAFVFVVLIIITFVLPDKKKINRNINQKPLLVMENNNMGNDKLKDLKNDSKVSNIKEGDYWKNRKTKSIILNKKEELNNKNAVLHKKSKKIKKKEIIKFSNKKKLKKSVSNVSIKKDKSEDNKKDNFELLVKKGDELFNSKEYLLAVESYRKALKIDKRVSLYVKIYQSLKSANNIILAKSYLEQGLKYFPESFAINKLMAINFIRSKEFDRALRSIDMALKKVNNDSLLYNYRGLCYFHKKNYEEAIKNFKKSLELNPNSFENYYYIGLIHDNLKNYKKALISYRMFLTLNKKNQLKRHTEWVKKRIKLFEESK